MFVDDPDTGPARATSHPDFVARCGAGLYYDGSDERTPFGSSEGREALRDAEQWFRDGGDPDRWSRHVLDEFAALARVERRDVLNVIKIADLHRYCAATGRDAPESPEDYDPVDERELLARALAGFKIAGVLAIEMKVAALASIDRLERGPARDDERWRTVLEQVRTDLTG